MAQIGCATGSMLVDSTNRYNPSASVVNSNTVDANTDVLVTSSGNAPELPVNETSVDPSSDTVAPIVNTTPVESSTTINFQLPDADLTSLTNNSFIRCSVGLYKASTNPVTGGTICVDFGYMTRKPSSIIPQFRPYTTQHITVPTNFNDIGYTRAFYMSEFGPGTITPFFDFVNNEVCRVELIHQLYDTAADEDEGAYFDDLIENFAVRIYGINTGGKNIGVACVIVMI